jgi:excinuclease ABC subunit A
MSVENIDSLDPRKFIIIKNARVHNLKNLSIAIPRNEFVVITGLSGSGKSSLAFDTIYAEGQRKYVESLSSYARQFVGKMNKPEVDYIKGISPAIAIEQKVNSRNPRSTVGTSTEIYDYLKLLFARIGKTYSPVSGHLVKKHSVTDVIDYINLFPTGHKILLFAPVKRKPSASLAFELNILLQKGFSRILHKGEVAHIEDILIEIAANEKEVVPVPKVKKTKNATEQKPAALTEVMLVLVDRFAVDANDEGNLSRIADSVQTAFFEGDGECLVKTSLTEEAVKLADGLLPEKTFSNRFEMDGMQFEEPSVHLFSFNNPFGACKTCEGLGSVIGVDEDLVIPDKSKSIYEGAIACWRGEKMKLWNDDLIMASSKFDFPVHRAYYDLNEEEKQVLWTGNKYFDGLDKFFKFIESQTYKIQYRVMLSRYRGKKICPDCRGSRLRKDATYVKVKGVSITDVILKPVKESLAFFKAMELDPIEKEIAKRLMIEITNRLQFLENVGLGYLTLNRLSNTLSGGESQRINLATSLGSSLVGSMYILDEPSIGLHPRDTAKLIVVIQSLKKLGNTVIVVEHDEEVMRAADQLIDIGPLAGSHGGELIFQGRFEDIQNDKKSLTAQYLMGRERIELPAHIRPWTDFIEIQGARENNLKNVTVKFPLGIMTVVTGVSGSGKTSLVKRVLYPALKKMFGGYGEQSGLFDKITGDINKVSAVEMIDQNPIGKSSRSNPVTYVKAYDEIRALYADLPLSKARGYKPSHFSFNVPGGRCEICEGEGTITVEMQFMADIELICEACEGKRFKNEVLEVIYNEKSIADVLDLTVEEALEFFTPFEKKSHAIEARIKTKLQPLGEVGLGYIRLGQASSTLSGGEAQRIKLASFLSKGNIHDHTVFVFDEPTTGLHFHDIKKLLYAFNALIEQGNTVLIIEHNPEVIKCADWVIDIGPEGGDAGGYIVFEGIPKDLIKCPESYTGHYLKSKFESASKILN